MKKYNLSVSFNRREPRNIILDRLKEFAGRNMVEVRKSFNRDVVILVFEIEEETETESSKDNT